ncbi:hypothetical protein ODZ84_05605 [Chryseobacterium fluminis]|uniref:hypothetical protein n=1 Tax=Chryseobacterium fluminis TaxID=2983606 RepID=UPI00225B0C72|nr:hypothetical protein [Chryseobacterium sp. MMS21-Ot14]UZT99046.1 hypothetical protein ODZ84_05605 [Chryseobacterium sp. MMS21-Ot14]
MQTFSTTPQTVSQMIDKHSLPQVRIAYFIMIHQRPEAFKMLFEKIYTHDQF